MHTNPAGLKWARHFDIDLFFLSLPHPPPYFSSLTPHPLLASPLAHHRAILWASAEEGGGRRGHIWKDGESGAGVGVEEEEEQ